MALDVEVLVRALIAQCEESGPEWYPISDPETARWYAQAIASRYDEMLAEEVPA